jgi:hypothetical protein
MIYVAPNQPALQMCVDKPLQSNDLKRKQLNKQHGIIDRFQAVLNQRKSNNQIA